MASFINSHVSFYEAEGISQEDYPSKKIHYQNVLYTPAQVRFLDFIDSNLTEEELGILLRDHSEKFSVEMRKINSYNILQKILKNPTSGREIGNLTLDGPNGYETPIKFKQIINTIRKK